MTFRPPNSRFWYALYTDELGRRRRVSTKKTTKRQADLVEAELRNKAERIRLGLEVRDRNPDKLTVADAAKWWLSEIASKQAQGAKLGKVIALHIIDDAIGYASVSSLTPARITSWLHSRSGVKGSTVNHLRSYLMAVYTALIDHGRYIGVNPVKATKRAAVQQAVPRSLPATYVRPLIIQAPTTGWRVCLAVAAYAGLRRSEIARAFAAGWPGVDLDARIITIGTSKRGTVRRVAIHAELLAILKTAQDINAKMPSKGALEGSGDVVKRALKRGGINDEAATFHGLRGAWASRMMACGASQHVVEYMGWGPRSSSVMLTHYIVFTDDMLRAEIDKLTWPQPEKK